MNKIIINRGSFRLDEVVFEQGTTTIGRASDNTISLNDTAVSSHHAKIVTLFHTSYIEDLDSTNGTLVNGKAVQKHTLHSGDIIALGNHQLLFQSDNVVQKSTETSETMMLHGNEIKQKLNEFIQAQSEQKLASEQLSPPQQQMHEGDEDALNNNAFVASHTPAFSIPPSLDKEKNKAWLEAKKSPPAEEKPPVVARKPEPKKPGAAEESRPTDEKAEFASKPQAIHNTATAIKATAKTTATPVSSSNQPTNAAGDIANNAHDNANANANAQDNVANKFPSKSANIVAIPLNSGKTNLPSSTSPADSQAKTPPESTAIDIAAAARAATQNRRHTDSSYTSPQGVMAFNRGKSRNKIMPMIWMLIVAVLIAEVVYITYRSVG